YFSSSTVDTTAKAAFDFNPGEINLKNVQFVYRDNRYDDPSRGIDFEDIRVNNIQATINDVRFDADTVYAVIENISFKEKSGFSLEYLEANAKVTPVSMSFENLLVKSTDTQINGQLTFDYEDISDFEEFIDKVKITSSFEESELSSNDLLYFAPDLKGLNEKITFSGKVKGTIAQLRGRNLNIEFADHSRFKGDISIAGLPDFEESFFDLVVDELITDKKEIESIPEYPFTNGTRMKLPENLTTLGKINFTGKFTGFLNDFVAYGNMNTAIGFISSDLNLKIDSLIDRSTYSGHLSASNFDIGTFVNNTNLFGKTSFTSNISGIGFSLEKLKAKMQGDINLLEVNGYEYKNIIVDGQISKRLFNGSLVVNEENLGLDFKGTIDLSKKVPEYDFTAIIKDAYLAKLNLINRDTTSKLSTTVDISVSGKDIDELTGYIDLENTEYIEINDTISIDTISYTSYTEGSKKIAQLKSDIVDFNMKGTYRRTLLYKEINELLAAYIPILPVNKTSTVEFLDINYSITFKNTKDVLKIFYPDLMIGNGTTIKGDLSKLRKNIEFKLTSDSIRYIETLFTGINLHAASEGQALSISNEMKEIEISDTLKLVNVSLSGTTDKTRSSFSLSTSSRDSAENYIKINGQASYLTSGQTAFKILPSEIKLNYRQWNIDPENSILIDSNYVDISNLNISTEDQMVSLSGRISKEKTDHLNLNLKNFDSSVLNPILSVYDVEISGRATGTADFAGLLSKPGINSDMNIKDIVVYSDTLGDASINFNYDLSEKLISIKALVDRGGMKNIEVDGKYFILPKNDSIDFNITLQKTNISAFSGYAKGLASDIKGKASGSVRISGPAKKPTLIGKIRLQQTSFLVDYLNTRFNLSDEVEFTANYFRFKNITVNDVKGNKAIVDGYIYHDHLRNFTLNFDIKATNFQMLNTNFSQNELFYGTAYGTGKIKIFGPLDLININLAVKTEKNTQIFIPLTNPDEVSQNSYIKFISPGVVNFKNISDEIDFSGIEMDFDLDVTPDAEVQLIFDSKIGDIIKGRGKGNINMNINTQGDFKMYGNYEVQSGDYLFTLQNLINKKFIINPGGTIRWSGSPYDAEIDLEGVYKLRASLYDLLQDTAYTKRIPVEVELSLKDQLFNPTIRFDIKVPDIDPTSETLINRYISTEEEKSKQTMSLLVLNKFAKPDDVEYQGQSSTGLNANAAEILSQQLSVWASQISDVVNVGVNYRAADAFSQEELEVALSTQLFNDRVSIDGNVGYSENNKNTSSLIGDFNVEVKVSKDGKFRFKAFNKTVNNSIINNYNSPYTQGIGIFYQEEFNTLDELINRFKDKFKKKEVPAETVVN
nr:translocation/assembly module TamB domain-containing protein [Bacteroidia bacterium]